MLNKIANDKNAVCFLVEAIAKRSQNIVWKVKVDGDLIYFKESGFQNFDKIIEKLKDKFDII